MAAQDARNRTEPTVHLFPGKIMSQHNEARPRLVVGAVRKWQTEGQRSPNTLRRVTLAGHWTQGATVSRQSCEIPALMHDG